MQTKQLKPRDPRNLYRSHYLRNGDTNARVAIFMREQPRQTRVPTDAELVTRPWENSHIHWFCSRTTARMHYAEIKRRADTPLWKMEAPDAETIAKVETARRILSMLACMKTVSFDADLGHWNTFEPMTDWSAPYGIEWNKTWDSSKYYEDTGPRPQRKQQPPEDTRPRIVMPSTGAAVLTQHLEEESPFPNELPSDFERVGRVPATLYKYRSITDIPNVGPTRRATLMTAFQTVDRLRIATPEQLQALPGIGPKVAEHLLECVNQLIPGLGGE